MKVWVRTQVVRGGCAALLAAMAVSGARAEGPEHLQEAYVAERSLSIRHERARVARVAARQRFDEAELVAQLAARRAVLERRSLVADVDRLRPFADAIAADKRIKVSRLRGPAPRHAIVVDVASRELHLHAADGVRISFPVATAEPRFQEYGVMRITKKRTDPIWIPTPNQRERDPSLPQVVRQGPDNPLGTRALNLSRGYLRIHGTNEPETIGLAVSDGCVRLSNTHVELLFDMVDVGMSVEIR